MTIVSLEFNVDTNDIDIDIPSAIQTSHASFRTNGFRRESCVSPGCRLISSINDRLLYATKNGNIRMLHAMDTQSIMMDIHENDIVHDIIVQKDSIWGSVASDSIVIWQDDTIVLHMELPNTIIRPIKLIWHDDNTNRFWLLCDDHQAILIDMGSGTVPAPTRHPVHQYMMFTITDITNFSTMRDVVDMAWSSFTVDSFVTLHTDGSVRVFEYNGRSVTERSKMRTNIASPCRCVVMGDSTILITSDENRTMTILHQGEIVQTLKFTGTNYSFVMEALVSHQRIILTSRDHGMALIVKLDGPSFDMIFPFHSTMAGYSFHCTMEDAKDNDDSDDSPTVQLRLYGPKHIQTWMLQEQQGVRPTKMNAAEQQFAEYTIEDEEHEMEDEVVPEAPVAPNAVANNPFVNWVGGISAQATSSQPMSLPKVQPPSLPKVQPPLPSVPAPSSMASPPPLNLAVSPSAVLPHATTTQTPQQPSSMGTPIVRAVPPPQPPTAPATTSAAALPIPPQSMPAMDLTELTTSIRSIIQEELVQQSSEISANVARTVMIPAMESMTQQILAKVSNHIEQQQMHNNRQLESMSQQLTNVTDLMGALTKDVQWIVRTQQQAARTVIPDTPVQTEAKLKDQVVLLLQQGDLEQALQLSYSSPTTDLTWWCCQQGELSDRLQSQPQSLSLQALFTTMHRLSTHIKNGSNASEAGIFLVWLQSICLALADRPIDTIASTDSTNAILQYAIKTCEDISSTDRRSVQMTLHLLKSLLR